MDKTAGTLVAEKLLVIIQKQDQKLQTVDEEIM